MSQYQAALWGNLGFRFACAFDYGGAAVLIQPVERTQVVSRGTYQVNNDLSVFAEVIASRTEATKQFEEYQVTTTRHLRRACSTRSAARSTRTSRRTSRPSTATCRSPTAGAAWSAAPRTIETTTDAYRFLAGVEGTLGGKWDCKLGVSTAGSEAESDARAAATCSRRRSPRRSAAAW